VFRVSKMKFPWEAQPIRVASWRLAQRHIPTA
jgi:hypothetical protein